MRREIKLMMILKYFYTHDKYETTELMELIESDVTELTHLIKEAKSNGWLTYINNPIDIYYDDEGYINHSITLTAAGENILDDEEYLSKLLLIELKRMIKLGNINSQIVLLPFLEINDYKYYLNYINNNGYISDSHGNSAFLPVKEEIIFFKDDIMITQKGVDFMKNNNDNPSISITNYGSSMQSFGDNNQQTMNTHNIYGFNSYEEVKDFADSLNEYEKPVIGKIIQDIYDHPEEKENIITKTESFLTNHPKLIATLTGTSNFLINHWQTLSKLFNL